MNQLERPGLVSPMSRRAILRGVGAGLATSLFGGWGDGRGPGGFPTNPQPVPSGPQTVASVTVSRTSAGTISPRFAGLSYEKSSMALPRFAGNNTDLIGMFRRLGRSMLRIGGNSVDRTHWTPNGAGRTSGQVAPADIDALSEFLHEADWKVLYGVNMGASTPADAAAEIAYAVQSLGRHLYGIEIGNECDLYGKTYFASETWTVTTFEQLWGQFRAAILEAAPHVVVTGPASASHVTTWTVPFGEAVGKQDIALLTQHYYRGNGQSPTSTAAKLITPDPSLVTQVGELKAGVETIGVPFRITETNSFYNGGASGISNSYASSLWVIDHLFNIALGGGVGANLHGGGNSTGYTPIADNNGVVVEARPEYYGVLLFTLAGEGRLLSTSVSASDLNVTAYAVAGEDRRLRIIIVNKDLTQNLSLTLDCGRHARFARMLQMTGPALDAISGVTIQGAAVEQDGGFSPQPPYTLPISDGQVTCYVNALSAALIVLE